MPNAYTLPGDLVVYNKLAQSGYLERIQENIALFNAQSGGAIRFVSRTVEGDFEKTAFYPEFGSIEHRDITTNADVDTKKLTGDEMVGVKTSWRFGPYAATEESFKRRARSVSEFWSLVGRSLADSASEYWANAALASVSAAIAGNGAVHATGTLKDRKGLVDGFRKFGDKFNRIGLFVMSSDNYFDIVDQAIADKLFEEAGFVIYGGAPGTLGKPVLVTDLLGDSPDYVYGLQRGAVTVTESQTPGFRSYEMNGKENLTLAYQAEGTFNVDVLGYSWAVNSSPAPAGENPNLAALGTAANWAKHATSNKNTAGVRIELT